jgi:hypothetical protein
MRKHADRRGALHLPRNSSNSRFLIGASQPYLKVTSPLGPPKRRLAGAAVAFGALEI